MVQLFGFFIISFSMDIFLMIVIGGNRVHIYLRSKVNHLRIFNSKRFTQILFFILIVTLWCLANLDKFFRIFVIINLSLIFLFYLSLGEFKKNDREVKSKKLITNDIEYTVKLNTNEQSVLELAKLPADQLIKVSITLEN